MAGKGRAFLEKLFPSRKRTHGPGDVSAVTQLLGTAELLEGILAFLPMRELLTVVPLVCKSWHDIVQSSPSIRKALFLLPADTALEAAVDAPRVVKFETTAAQARPRIEDNRTTAPSNHAIFAVNPMLLSRVGLSTRQARELSFSYDQLCPQHHKHCFNIDSLRSGPGKLRAMLLVQPPQDVCAAGWVCTTTTAYAYAGEQGGYVRPVHLSAPHVTLGDLIPAVEEDVAVFKSVGDEVEIEGYCLPYAGWPSLDDYKAFRRA